MGFAAAAGTGSSASRSADGAARVQPGVHCWSRREAAVFTRDDSRAALRTARRAASTAARSPDMTSMRAGIEGKQRAVARLDLERRRRPAPRSRARRCASIGRVSVHSAARRSTGCPRRPPRSPPRPRAQVQRRLALEAHAAGRRSRSRRPGSSAVKVEYVGDQGGHREDQLRGRRLLHHLAVEPRGQTQFPAIGDRRARPSRVSKPPAAGASASASTACVWPARPLSPKHRCRAHSRPRAPGILLA